MVNDPPILCSDIPFSQRKYNKARLFYIETLKMRKRLFREDHLDVVSSLDDLAKYYDNREDYNKAEFFYIQALEIKKRLFNGDHCSIFSSLIDLSLFYCIQKNHLKAKSFYDEALRMKKRLLNSDYPDVPIDTLNERGESVKLNLF